MRLRYRLFDAFNSRALSQHRTAAAAGRAARKVDNAMAGGSYLPLVLLRLQPASRRGIAPAYLPVPQDGTDLDDDAFAAARSGVL